MPSRPDARLLPSVAALTALLAIAAAAPVLRAEGQAPTAVEISKAIETVKKDPNLDTEMTVKTLRWTGKRQTQKKQDWAFLAWFRDLVRWFERSMRMFVWVGVAILAVWLAVSVARLVGGRGPRRETEEAFVAPTHVRDLDIRPEALPPDIGAAARALWDRGEQRAALALLYRGLLSRLAHVHRVPIRDSSTEGDCLELAGNHLAEPSRRDYASRLIRVWQRAVYGSQDPPSATVHDLCDSFARALDLAPRLRLRARAVSRPPRAAEAPHDAPAPHRAVGARDRPALRGRHVGRESHRVGRAHGAAAAEGRGGHESVLRRAAFRRSARRDDELGSHLRRAVAGCGDRALDVAMESEREPSPRDRTLGRERRPPRGRPRHLGRRRRLRALVRHRLAGISGE